MTVRRLVLDGILLCLLIISSWISFPLPMTEIVFTLQVFAIFIIIMITPLKDSLLIIGIYIFMGLIGIPVFATGGGLGYIIRPSFGFILGFLWMPIPLKLSRLLPVRSQFIQSMFGGLMALLLLYSFGLGYFYIIRGVYEGNSYQFMKVLQLTVLPFLPLDILKCVLSSIITGQLKKSCQRYQ